MKNFKKLFYTFGILSALLSLSAPVHATEIPEQTLGGISYFVLVDTKSVAVELPYVVTMSLVKLSSSYGLSVLGKIDADAERPEIPALRAKYPGFEIQYMAPQNFKSIIVDLGIQRPVQPIVPTYGADNFSVLDKLTVEEGKAILNNVSNGHGLEIKIVVETKKPTRTVVAQVNYDLADVCTKLSHAAKPSMGGVIAAFSVVARNILSVKSDKLRENAVKSILGQCVGINEADSVETVSDLLALPVQFLQPTGSVSMTDYGLDYVPVEKTWNSSLKVVSQ